MNILRIKEKINAISGKKVHIKINGTRNQIEEIDGIIKETYNYIFIIESEEKRRSFSYSDILIGNIEISEID